MPAPSRRSRTRRSPDPRRVATATTGRCAGGAAESGHGSSRRRRSLCCRRWVRSHFPFGGVDPCASDTALAGDAPVVDFAPEVAVVRGVWDRDFLAGVLVMSQATAELQFFGVNV